MAGTAANVIAGPVATFSWGADIGYLKGPVAVGIEGDVAFFEVDQEINPLSAKVLMKAFYVSLVCAEPTLANIASAWDETITDLGNADMSPSAVAISWTQDGAGATTRTWTFTAGVSYDYGEIVTEKGGLVLLPVKAKMTGPPAATTWHCAEI